MTKAKDFFNKSCMVIVPILILIWTFWLPGGNEYLQAFRSTNTIMGIIGLFAYYFDKKNNGRVTLWQNILICLFSFLFSIASVLSGLTSSAVQMPIIVMLSSLGAFFSAYSVIHAILTCEKSKLNTEHGLTFKPWVVFIFCFSLTAVIYLIVLFTAFYPGNLTPDSISQVEQILTGNYSNHHPYYHTVVIGVFINLGKSIFNDINAGVALFHIFQILVMSAIFAFLTVTLYQKKSPLWMIIASVLWYTLHPVNIIYSFTMWKDVLFGGAALLFITCLARIFLKIGKNNILNYILVFLSGFAFCVWRSNGLYAFVLTAILILVVFFKKYKLLTAGLLAVAICSYILVGPVLKTAKIPSPDTIEHLSIPAQQIARVVTDGCKLTDDEYEFLSNVIDIDEIPQNYQSYISDPIKNLIRIKEGDTYISEHKGEFLKLWIKLGIKYPKQYVAAWVDQTKGYYHSGHNYWITASYINENSFGITQTPKSLSFRNVISYYNANFSNTEKLPILNIFVSIGFMFWIMAGAFVVALAKGNLKTAFVFAPIILIILSLLIATPVYSEFRYAYGLFISLPIIGIMMGRKDNSLLQGENK